MLQQQAEPDANIKAQTPARVAIIAPSSAGQHGCRYDGTDCTACAAGYLLSGGICVVDVVQQQLVDMSSMLPPSPLPSAAPDGSSAGTEGGSDPNAPVSQTDIQGAEAGVWNQHAQRTGVLAALGPTWLCAFGKAVLTIVHAEHPVVLVP